MASSAAVKGKGGNKKLKELEKELTAKHAAEIEAFNKQKKAAKAEAEAAGDSDTEKSAAANDSGSGSGSGSGDTKTAAGAAAAGGDGGSGSGGAAGAAAAASDESVSDVTSGVSGLSVSVDSKTGHIAPLAMGSGHAKLTKAAKKKQAKSAKDAARTAELREQHKDAIDMRAVEMKQFAAQLQPIALTIQEIPSDGHCLFRAVHHQLTLNGASPHVTLPPPTSEAHLSLRRLTADHMRSKADLYQPFLTDDNGDQLDSKAFDSYCQSLVASDPVAWGGQHEIAALTHVLGRQIIVHSAKGQPLVMGDKPTGANENLKPLRISFHEHYFGAGHHYNSVVPISGSGSAAAKK